MLLKESSPRRRQGLALKLAVVLCGLALLVNLNGPTDTNIGVTFSSNKEEKKVTAAAGSSSPRPAASTMNMMDWRAAAVAAPAWSVEDNDTTRTPYLERVLDKGPPPRAEFVASAEYEDVNSTYWRGLVTSVENEWYGTQAGSMVDVLILQSNYPADIVKTVVEADNANWFFTNVYGPLAASQAAGAAPIIKAWLAGEELPATFP